MFSTVGATNNGRDAAGGACQREGVGQAFRSRTDLFAGYSGHAATDLGKILSFNFLIVPLLKESVCNEQPYEVLILFESNSKTELVLPFNPLVIVLVWSVILRDTIIF